MISQTYRKTLFVTFLVAYIIGYGLLTYVAAELFADSLWAAWPLVSPFRERLIAAAVCWPVMSALVGCYVASARLLSYNALGTERMTRARFYGMGCVAMLAGNWLVVVLSLRWALPQAVGQAAMELIGVDRFNLMMLLCVPSLAFAAGVLAVLIVAAIIEAQVR
jgi:hypothetical protein